jgi:hypothetical protein
MESSLFLRSAHFACSPSLPTESVRTRANPNRKSLPGFILAVGALLIVAPALQARLFAQQDPIQNWPPDDNYNAQAPQQYAPQYPDPNYQQQPNGYNQPQQYGYAPQQQFPANPAYGQGYQGAPQLATQPSYGQQLAPMQPALSPDQLTQMVAPIALYPDALVAQILTASTYPAQVTAADQWRRSMGNAPGEQVAAGADAQGSWDPSIKALTAFPQVLAMMDQNLQWTTALGNAYYNQPQDVLQTIQVLRQRAENSGNLQSGPQEQVSDNQGYIDIAPTNPQEVYLPSYNPWAAYGQPISPYPGFSLLGAIGNFIGSAFMNFGPGIAMNAFMTTPWGWLGWGLDWLAHAILFHHSDYWTHSGSVRDWGFPHGGPRYAGWRNDDRGGWDHGSSYRAFNRDNYGHGGPGRPVGGPVHSFGDARANEGFNRGYASRNSGYNRFSNPGQQAYNHAPQVYGRPQQPIARSQSFGSSTYPARPDTFAHQNYSSGYGAPSRGNYPNSYTGRSGMAFAGSSQGFSGRGGTSFGDIGARGYGGYSGNAGGYSGHSSNSYSGSERSGGFHLFGGGHGSNEYKAPKSYGGGHSGWGGGGGSFKAPKAPRESHSFGGGHSSGGGHSGGGHGHHH